MHLTRLMRNLAEALTFHEVIPVRVISNAEAFAIHFHGSEPSDRGPWLDGTKPVLHTATYLPPEANCGDRWTVHACGRAPRLMNAAPHSYAEECALFCTKPGDGWTTLCFWLGEEGDE